MNEPKILAPEEVERILLRMEDMYPWKHEINYLRDTFARLYKEADTSNDYYIQMSEEA